MPETYLGDGVYAKFDGWGYLIYTSNGVTTSTPIYLEPEVIQKLIDFKTSTSK